MQVLCLYETRNSKPRAIYCDTFYCNHLAHVIAPSRSLSNLMGSCSFANAKICVLLYSFCSVLFQIWRQFPITRPRGFFALRVRGAFIWRDLYMEGLIFEFYGNYFGLPRVGTHSPVWPIRSDETLNWGISRLRHCDPR